MAKNKILKHDREACIECAGCVGMCPTMALDMYKLDLQLFHDKCIACNICVRSCPVGALSLVSKESKDVQNV